MSFALTDTGEQEATKVQQTRRGPEAAVLAYMYEMNASEEPVNLDDVMTHTRMPEEKTLLVMKRLVNMGLIEET